MLIENASEFQFIKNVEIKNTINPNWEFFDKLTRINTFICDKTSIYWKTKTF
jgi:hypothetical protein